MSYILDALKRAEQQRGGAARVGVRLPRDLPLEAAARGPWPWIAATAVGVAAIVGIVTLWPATAPMPITDAPAPLPSSTPPLGGAATTGNRPAAALAPSRPSDASPSRVVAPSTPPARGVQPATRAAESRASAPPATRAPSPAPTERGTTARVARPRPVDHDAAEMAPSPVAPELERAEARPAPERRPAPAPLPAAGGEAKALAAKISLQVLSWAPEPKDRFVFLNGRRYAEGQLIDDKLRVERIMEDGVVLSYRGEQVTLKGR